MKPYRVAALAALLGSVLPVILLEASWRFSGHWDGLFLVLWPSSLELKLFDNSAPMPTFEVVMIYATSIGINILLYAGIAWSGAFFYLRP
jgi:hypothetical protein